jgi:hypothetical protein
MIGIVYGGYYLVQPYIKSLINTYDQTVSGYQKIKDLEANFGANIQDIVK